MSKTQLSILFAILLVASIAATRIVTQTGAQQAQPAPVANNDYQTGAVLWFQHAAENRALAYQAFNLASLRLDAELKRCRKERKKSPCAIVTDVDETVLDNSPNQAWLIKNQQNFTQANWQNWVNRAAAKPIPGAVEFLNRAAASKIRVFYITNRSEAERAATADNLRKAGFPDVSDETLLLRGDTSSKEARRQTVAQKHRIVLLVGDNLNDLAQVFERKSIADRFAAVDNLKNDFGARFIVLPNPMYGDWESALYEYNLRRSDAEKADLRRNLLQTY